MAQKNPIIGRLIETPAIRLITATPPTISLYAEAPTGCDTCISSETP
jgi:hypothetical protein